mgnify:FL=1|tara:strand:+ start:757 stop:993 length:237 start_codon:yes stop_codon:yes gene_type:complete
MSLKYVIINANEVNSVDFSQVKETSADTIRYSVDGSKTFVKYEGAKPSFLYGKDTFTHTQILAILATDEWTYPDSPPE